nr:hypothetical protein [uncultured Alistipes sp.]
MLTDLIAQYLTAHKRLVVPQLGAFIVKEPDHTVLFSELLRRDDGVLRQVLRDAGMAELEAAGEIDRFVFEVRHAVEHGGTYRMRGFGQMAPGPNGTIAFHYDPQLDVAPQPAAPSAAEEPAHAAPADGARAHSDDGNGGEEGGKSRHHAPLRPDKVAEAVKAAFAETRISPSAKMNPDPSLRGLRYGKPPKTTDAYTYVDEPPRRRADRFLWIAIIAAAIAVAAIAFGYYREAQERRAEEQYLLELTGGASGDEASGDVSAEGDDATNESNH